MLRRQEKMLESYHLEGHDYLNDYIALIKAVKTENTDDVVKLYKKVFSKDGSRKIAYLYFTPVTTLKGMERETKEALSVLTKKIAENVTSIPIQSSLMGFANITLPKL